MEEYEYEMPTPCVHCGKIFDLNDGYCSRKWHKDTTICEECHEKEEQEIERDEEIEDFVDCIEMAITDFESYAESLKKLNAIDKISDKAKRVLEALD